MPNPPVYKDHQETIRLLIRYLLEDIDRWDGLSNAEKRICSREAFRHIKRWADEK